MRRALAAAAPVAAVAALFAPIDAGTTWIVDEIAIGEPPATVYAYVTTPANWPKWHPSSRAVHGDAGHPLTVGESVVEDFVVAGQRGTVTWRVVERDSPARWKIAGTIDGREAGTVSYELAAADGGTRFVRTFVYRRPSLFFALADRFVLRQRIDGESREALQGLKRQLEAPPPGRS